MYRGRDSSSSSSTVAEVGPEPGNHEGVEIVTQDFIICKNVAESGELPTMDLTDIIHCVPGR